MLRTLTSNTTYTLPIGKRFIVAVSGTFGGGTVSVKYATNVGATTFATYATVSGAFTAAGEREFAPCGATDTVQITLTGSTTPSIIVTVREFPW
jgi:hypothetical protein